MAILLTGGTGKTSLRIAPLLQEAKIPFLLASRRGQDAAPAGMPAVKFDWLDASTYKDPFEHKFPGEEAITAVYLVAPQIPNPVGPLNAFIDYAVKDHGVKKFVLMAAVSVEPGGPHVGGVWSHLIEIGVQFCVLKPTWFMENFSEGSHSHTIKSQDRFYTACGDGKVPFISATDIARLAYHALTDKKTENTDYLIVGTGLFSHDEVAATLSKHLGREIVHVKLTPEQRRQSLLDAGLSEGIAGMLVWIESQVATGEVVPTDDTVEKVTGKPPQTLDAFVQENKAVWG